MAFCLGLGRLDAQLAYAAYLALKSHPKTQAAAWRWLHRVRGPYAADGFRYRIRAHSADALVLHPNHERETRCWLRKRFAGGQRGRGLFIDVGAHCGTYSTELSPYFAHVLALEPSADNAAALRANLALNGLESKVEVVAAAAADVDGNLTFYLCSDDTNSLIDSGQASRAVTISGLTLDTMLRSRGIAPCEVALIKIDVEGAESAVITGARELLEQGAPVLVIEAVSAEAARALATQMESRGYLRCATLDERNHVFERRA